MSGWRKCDTCRKVLPAEAFDGASPTCRSCLMPAPATRSRALKVSSRQSTAHPAPSAPAGPRFGSVGSGDLEVRERRAKRAATDALVEANEQEYAALLRTARAAEGLRPLGDPPPDPPPDPTAGDA